MNRTRIDTGMGTPPRDYYACTVLLLVLGSMTRIAASSSSSSFPSTSSLLNVPSSRTSTSPITPSAVDCVGNTAQQEEERIQELSRLLCDRHGYVMAGHRMSDFSEWVRSQGGESKIFSMHGVVDVNFNMDELHNIELAVEVYPSAEATTAVASSSTALVRKQQQHARGGDPFLPDRMNLNQYRVVVDVADNTGSDGVVDQKTAAFYNGDVHDWDEKPPTNLQLALRALKLSLVFAPVATTSWLAMISPKFRRGVWYKWVANCLATSGAAFIKYGQWSSTRPDMFPVSFCDALSVLHNSAPAHSWNFTQEEVESSLDIPRGSLLEVFESFDEKPLASGSIAQVHKARLKNGCTVAAKVRHPRVAELIDMDFRLMTMVASACDWIPGLKWLHVRDSVAQFSHTMAAQAHLNVEAHHLEVLNHNFRSWKHVRFPQPFFASQAVILETFEPGNIVTDILDVYDQEAQEVGGGVVASDLIPIDLARFIVSVGLSLYLKMLFIDGVMHADLHPGNIMLDIQYPEDDSGKNNPKLGITLVDAGMVAQLTEEESFSFIGLMTSLGAGDGVAAAQHAMNFSVENSMTLEQREAFTEDMVKLFSDKCRGYGTNVDVGDVLQSVLGVIRDHKVRIDANYATLVINAMCVESLGKRVCPSYNVLDAARPLLQAYRKNCFDKDGYTRIASARHVKRMKRVMPFLLDRQKESHDKAFFKQIQVQRKTSRRQIARGGDEQLPKK